ncbi:unnamed protein product [Closterium sp. NIES-54]
MSNPVAGTQNAGSTAIASALKDVPVERIVGPGNDEVVKIGSFWESQPVVIHFLRRFGCRICRGGAMEMSRAIPHLHNAGVRVVAIGRVLTALLSSPPCCSNPSLLLTLFPAAHPWDHLDHLDHLGVEEFVDGGYWKGFSLTPSLPRCPAAHCPPCCSLLLTAAPCCSLPSLLLSAAPCCSLPSLLPTGLDHLGVDVFVNGGYWKGAAFLTHTSLPPHCCSLPRRTLISASMDHLGVDEFVGGGYWKGGLYIDDGKRTSLPPCTAAHRSPLPSLHRYPHTTGLDHLGLDEFVDGGYWKGELYIDDGKRAYSALQLKSISLWQVAYQLLFDKTVKKSLGDTANVKGDLAGDGLQLGATFLFDRGGKLLHEFRQVTVADHPSPEELLKPFGIDSSVLSGVTEARGVEEGDKKSACEGEECFLHSTRSTLTMAFATRATSCQLRLPANLPLYSGPKAPASLRLPVVRAAAGDAESSGAEKPRAGEPQGERAKGIFEFVTDNPSSRSAIQLKNAPAMDGNVGQMISAIEDKGKDMGSYLLSGEFQYFVRQIGNAKDPLVVYLHGAPAQSWGFREVMQQMAEKGYRGIAPDWLGFGFSEKPQPGYYFAYTEDVYHQELDRLLETLNVTQPFYLVVHGYLVGSYGLTWALKNASRLKGLAILNTPLSASSPLPQIFQQLRLPFVGEFQCQNAVLAERFIEKGSPYSLELDNADVYRLPYLDSGEPGFSLLETARKANPKQMGERIQNTLSASRYVFSPLVSSPLLSSPLLSSPLLSSPLRSSPLLSSPLRSSPLLSSPLLSSPLLSSPLLSSFLLFCPLLTFPPFPSPLLSSPFGSSLLLSAPLFSPPFFSSLIAWGKDDPYIPITEAQAIAKANSSSVTLRVLEGAGHTPQEDWSEKVVDSLRVSFN